MVERPRQRKLCLSIAIVVVCTPAAQMAEQQRAVVKFHISRKPVEPQDRERGRKRLCPGTHSVGVWPNIHCVMYF